jgi:hypothetical protein
VNLIWATRGRSWGFWFLRRGGFKDPLPVYDTAFSGLEEESEARRRVPSTRTLSEMVALRFPDPLGRQDRAGRVIRHDFVIFPPLADEIDSVEDGRRLVWPLVADEFTRVWDLPTPTSRTG